MKPVSGPVLTPMLGVMLLGWLVPLGVVMLRSGGSRKSPALVVVGVVWGFFGLAGLGVVLLMTYGGRGPTRTSRLETFAPAQYGNKTGVLVLPCAEKTKLTLAQLILARKYIGTRLVLSTPTGSMVAPAGTWLLESCHFHAADASGVTWQASGYLRGREPLVVRKGQTQVLKIGPPFTAKIDVSSPGGDVVALDLKLTGVDGTRYTLRPRPPAFQVLNEAGVVVWQGSFQYG